MELTTNLFDRFAETSDEHELSAIREQLEAGGYSDFYRFLEHFRERLKRYGDEEAEQIRDLIQKARETFPNPGSISPSWQDIWGEFACIHEHKTQVLKKIPASEREGEWQILIDNPYTNREIACYPGLSFEEAAYLYGYFHHDLNQNEYIRLQKIQTVIMDYGG